MDAGEVEPERLSSVHHGAQVRVAAKQVVGEFATQCLFPTHKLPSGDRIPFSERRDRVELAAMHDATGLPSGNTAGAAGNPATTVELAPLDRVGARPLPELGSVLLRYWPSLGMSTGSRPTL